MIKVLGAVLSGQRNRHLNGQGQGNASEWCWKGYLKSPTNEIRGKSREENYHEN